MKFFRRFFIYPLALLGIFLFAGIALGYFFKDKLHVIALKELENTLNAEIRLDHTDVSFLKSFPEVAVSLKRLTINASGYTEGMDFIHVAEARFILDLWDFLSGEYSVKSLKLYYPEVKLVLDEEGQWNYEGVFSKNTGEDSAKEEKEVLLELKKVSIWKGKFLYLDQREAVRVATSGIEALLSGDFGGEAFKFESELDFFLEEWRVQQFAYMEGKTVSANLEMDTDLRNGEKFTFKQAEIEVAELMVFADAVLSRAPSDENFTIDLNCKTRESSFASLISVLPPSILEPLQDYAYEGNFSLNGWIRGPLGKGASPDMFADYAVSQASLQYKGFTNQLDQVRLSGSCLYKPGLPALSHLIIDESRAMMNGRELKGSFAMRNFNDPNLDLFFHGKLDLGELKEFYPSFAKELNALGKVDLDIKGKGKRKDIMAGNYLKVQMEGKVLLEDVWIRDPHLVHPLENIQGELTLDNSRIEMRFLSGKTAQTDFRFTGKVTDYLGYLLDSTGVLKADLDLESENFSLNDLFQKQASPKMREATSFQMELPPRLDVRFNASVKNFEFDALEANNVRGEARVHEQMLELFGLEMDAFQGHTEVNGSVAMIDRNRADAALRLQWKGIDINKAFKTFGQWGDFVLVEDHMHGITTGSLSFVGSLDNQLNLEEKTLLADGHVAVYKGRLEGFKPLEALAGFVKLEKLQKVVFEDIQTEFSIKNGFFILPEMEVKAYDYKMKVSGQHGFDNSLDYYLSVELPRIWMGKSSPPALLEYIEEDQGQDLNVILPIRITGTTTHPKFALDRKFVASSIKKGLQEEKVEMKTAFTEEVEEIFGEKDTTDVTDWIEVEGEDQDKEKFKLGKLFKGIRNPFKPED